MPDVDEMEKAPRDFEVLADTMPDIVIRYDAALRYLFVNHAAEALIGRQRGEIVGHAIGEFGLPAALAARYAEHVALALANAAPSTFEYELVSEAGARAFEIRVVPEPGSAGQPATVLAIGRDITERRRAEALLRESEARWRDIANETPALLWMSDAGPPNTFVNDALAAFLGVEASALGATWTDYVHPDDRAEAGAAFDAARRGHVPFHAEFRLRRGDGAWRWVVDTARPRVGANGEFLGFAGAIVDVTERRDAEEQLRFAADAARLLGTSLELDELIDGVTRIGVPALGELCIVDLFENGRHTRRLGAADLKPEVRALADEFVRVSRPLAAGALLRRIVDDHAPMLIPTLSDERRAEIRARNPAVAPLIAGVRSLLAVPLIARGEVLGALTFAVLASDRVLGQRELALATVLAERAAVAIQNARLYAQTRDAAARLRGFFDVKGVFFCVFEVDDAQDDFVFVQPNDAFAAFYGRTAATLAGRRGREIGIPAERIAFFTALLRRCRASTEPVVIELSPAGMVPPVTVLASLNRIERPNASPAIAFVATDITGRKELEAQFLQAQKMEAVGRLAGGVAHDFNNLLTVIGGCADFLLEVIPEGHEGREDALEVKRTAERAATLTRQLLTFSSRQVVRPRDVDVSVLVRDAERLLRRLIGEDVALRLALDPAAGVVHLDPGQLEQALVNLVVNARDAMPNGGRLTLSTERVAREDGAYVALAVRDTGTGMDEATQSRIFEPFFTTKPLGKGTGLGLATVFGIVTQAGGRVLVDSAPGAGSTFTLLIPAVDVASRADGSRAGAAPAPHGHERILLVEDDPRVRRLTQRVLELHGYDVTDAAGGMEALELPSRAPIDLLLTDVVLPGMNGRELYETLAARHPGLRVLFMSGYTADALAHHRVSELGAPFLEKPFAVAALVRAVRDAIDAKR